MLGSIFYSFTRETLLTLYTVHCCLLPAAKLFDHQDAPKSIRIQDSSFICQYSNDKELSHVHPSHRPNQSTPNLDHNPKVLHILL